MNISCSVSIGEALDKLSILEIKKEKIDDLFKKELIDVEINFLLPIVKDYVDDYYYPCLKIINTLIWNGMENIKKESKLFSVKSRDIFANNDARFRCKKKLNDLYSSRIVEVKSYTKEKIILVTHEYILPEINEVYTKFLLFYYDEVELHLGNYSGSNIFFNIEGKNGTETDLLHANDKNPLLSHILSTYNFDTLNYTNYGSLGDLLHVCYVIKMKFLETGKKGNIFLHFDEHKYFNNGSDTYEDIKNFISSQFYINKIGVFEKNINIDIDLNIWRDIWLRDWSLIYYRIIEGYNWMELLPKVYSLLSSSMLATLPFESNKLLQCPWLNSDIKNPKYMDSIIINRSSTRHEDSFPWESIVTKNKCIFISFTGKDFIDFPFRSKVGYIRVSSFDEMATIINSCKFFIGNQSMPLALAYCMFKPCLGELCYDASFCYTGLEKYNPNYSFISMFKRHIDIERFGIKL